MIEKICAVNWPNGHLAERTFGRGHLAERTLGRKVNAWYAPRWLGSELLDRSSVTHAALINIHRYTR